jgi:hypothetical protein
MTSIHYFPRYSQKENMVTNNTLLLFSRLYNHSTDQFNRFINTLLEGSNIEELDTTIKFHQQVKKKNSVPDAVIEQQSFKIIIETKLYGQENIKQIKKHCDSFNNEDRQLFLWINKEKIKDEYYQRVIKTLNEINENREKKISFASTTFKEICRCFNEVLSQYDREMIGLVDDYEAFCNESILIDNADTKLRVILSGTTYEQNLKYNIYYASRDRSYQNHKYLGLYKDKAVRAIGEVISSVDISYDLKSDALEILETQLGIVTESQIEAIKRVIFEAKEKYGYDLSDEHRFFFVEKYYQTKFIKPTKGGLMGQKYFDLADIEGFSENMSTEEIALLLNGREW